MQGSQITSIDFIKLAAARKIKINMEGKVRYLGNIFIERLRRSLKYECAYLRAWETRSEARLGVGR